MVNTASLFTQILSLFQRSDFARHVRELKVERHARGFSSWSQFVAMLFCQLAQARSLREITDGLQSGERVVVSGLAQIRPGIKVEPKLVEMPGLKTQSDEPAAERAVARVARER